MRRLPALWRILLCATLIVTLASAVSVVICFPWSVDPDADKSLSKPHVEYYERTYAEEAASQSGTGSSACRPLSAKEQFYVDFALGVGKGVQDP